MPLFLGLGELDVGRLPFRASEEAWAAAWEERWEAMLAAACEAAWEAALEEMPESVWEEGWAAVLVAACGRGGRRHGNWQRCRRTGCGECLK